MRIPFQFASADKSPNSSRFAFSEHNKYYKIKCKKNRKIISN